MIVWFPKFIIQLITFKYTVIFPYRHSPFIIPANGDAEQALNHGIYLYENDN